MKTIITYTKTHKWVSYLFALAVFVSFGFLMHKSVDEKAHKPVVLKGINIHHVVDGHNMVESDELRKLIENETSLDLTKTNIETLNLTKIEHIVEGDPFVKEAEVFINAANEMEVKVWQRDPIMRVMDKEGYSYYVDQFKHRVPFSKVYTARVPVITGEIKAFPEDDEKEWDELQKAVYQIVQIVSQDKILSALISQIHVSGKDGIIIHPVIGDEEILFGNTKRIDDKLENLKIFYQNGMRQEGWNKYNQIDLRYEDLVLGRKKNSEKDIKKNIEKS